VTAEGGWAWGCADHGPESSDDVKPARRSPRGIARRPPRRASAACGARRPSAPEPGIIPAVQMAPGDERMIGHGSWPGTGPGKTGQVCAAARRPDRLDRAEVRPGATHPLAPVSPVRSSPPALSAPRPLRGWSCARPPACGQAPGRAAVLQDTPAGAIPDGVRGEARRSGSRDGAGALTVPIRARACAPPPSPFPPVFGCWKMTVMARGGEPGRRGGCVRMAAPARRIRLPVRHRVGITGRRAGGPSVSRLRPGGGRRLVLMRVAPAQRLPGVGR
jgi:hypothetical protein